jgi:hypothetical protein
VVLKAAGVPIPKVQPAAVPDYADKEHQSQQVLIPLLATLERFDEKLPTPVLTEMRSAMKALQIRPEQLSRSLPVASAEKLYHVEKRGEGQFVDLAVTRNGQGGHLGTFDSESEARVVCENLNTSPVACLTLGSPRD